MNLLPAFKANRNGSTAVEFGMTAPLFILLLFGVVELGIALWTQYGLQYGVEAAARCATVNPTTCDNASDTAAYAANNALGLSVPASTFTVATADCGNQITASYAYSFFTSYFGQPTVTLTAKSCFPQWSS